MADELNPPEAGHWWDWTEALRAIEQYAHWNRLTAGPQSGNVLTTAEINLALGRWVDLKDPE